MIAPVLDEIAKEQGENIRIARVDAEASLALTARFGIRNIPTLLFFKGGEVKDAVIGLTSKADLEAGAKGAGSSSASVPSASARRPIRRRCRTSRYRA
jgi:thiol-disulfide isomerase/thioredoxin